MPSYWLFNGKNGLQGLDGTMEVVNDCPPMPRVIVHPDPDNPAVLSQIEIVNALHISRIARADFQRIFPTLLPEEQARLETMLDAFPRDSDLVLDDQAFADAVQRNSIRSIPVRTTGRRGGKGGRGA